MSKIVLHSHQYTNIPHLTLFYLAQHTIRSRDDGLTKSKSDFLQQNKSHRDRLAASRFLLTHINNY